MKKQIYDFFNPWKRNKQVSVIIYQNYVKFNDIHFEIDTTHLNSIGFVDILTRVEKLSGNKIFVIKIICKRPGILIGKQGIDLDILKEKIQSEFKLPIKINIIEDNLFNWNKGYKNSPSFLMEIK